MDIEKPVAIITGASSGVGALTVEKLVEGDYSVVALSRNYDGRLVDIADRLGVEPIICDVGQASQVREAAERIKVKHPSITLLAHFAGMTLRKRFLEATDEEIDMVVQTNLIGPSLLTRDLIEPLKAGSPSRVLFMSSATKDLPNANSAYYSVTKGAVRDLALVAHRDLESLGISVSVLMPGNYDSDGHPFKCSGSIKSRLTTTNAESVVNIALKEANRTDNGYHEVLIPRTLKLISRFANRHPQFMARVVDHARSSPKS